MGLPLARVIRTVGLFLSREHVLVCEQVSPLSVSRCESL